MDFLTPHPFRLIIDPPRTAALNMAIDEYLLESQKKPGALPTLRFYRWSEPAYSIGYFQSVEETAKRFRCKEKRISVVRRLTGGGIVEHGKDLTFSLTMRYPNELMGNTLKDSYLRINSALLRGLKPLYPELDFVDCHKATEPRPSRFSVCFEEPVCTDLALHGKKVVGASQRRRRGVLLYQSSVFLSNEYVKLMESVLRGFKSDFKIDFLSNPLTDQEEFEAIRFKASVFS